MDRIEKLKQFLAGNPEDSFLTHALALEYIKQGDDKTAKQLFEELLDRNPGYVGSYYHLAKLLEHAGEQEQARRWYEKGMEEARKAGEQHAYGELRSAYDELVD